ncbi:MAG: hypothetical protein RIT04_140 [Candidatus Parcubacteria bacterium]|jgi:hypothetical protein
MPFVPNPLMPNALITTEKVLVIPANPFTNPPTPELWSIKLKCELSTPISHEQSLGKYRWLLTENEDCSNPGAVNEEHNTMENWFVLPNTFKVGDKLHVRGTVYIGGISPAPIANWSEPPLMITIDADMVAAAPAALPPAPALPAVNPPTPPPAPVVPAPVATPPVATPPVVVVQAPTPVVNPPTQPAPVVPAPVATPPVVVPTTPTAAAPTAAAPAATAPTTAAPTTTGTAAAPATVPTTPAPKKKWRKAWDWTKGFISRNKMKVIWWTIALAILGAFANWGVHYILNSSNRASDKFASITTPGRPPTPAPAPQSGRPTVYIDPHASRGHVDQIVAAGSSPGIPVSMTYSGCAIVNVTGNNINVVNGGNGASNILFGASSIIGSMPAVPTAAPTAPTNPPAVVVPPPAWPSNGPAKAFADLPTAMTHGQDEGCIVLALSPGEDVEYKNTAAATIAATPVEWVTTAFEVACDGVVQTEGRLTTNGFQAIRIHCTAPTNAGPQRIKIRLKKL